MTRRVLMTRLLGAVAAPCALLVAAERIPAYHEHPSKDPLPPTKDPGQYIDRPVVQRVYELAAKVKPELYQMPCYCNCDKFAGHGSLLDCFVDAHGEECGVCQREAVYTYMKVKAHVPVKEIRAGIMAGDWRKVDLTMASLTAL
jgi:hypothetical protein